MIKEHQFDYIVIGSGISGLFAAHYLSNFSKTCLISKGDIEETSTQLAQGGIAVALNKTDTPKAHMEDTVQAGAGLCDELSVKVLVEKGPDRVRELIKMGANFDRIGADYDYTREAAHTNRRILHAGDGTGREIETTLSRLVQNKNKTEIFSKTTVVKILVDKNRYYGCVAVNETGETLIFYSKAVLLATGGCGQIYLNNTNPGVVTGDGISLAYEAGCELQDLEFIQFHPTTLFQGSQNEVSHFVISEAVRGEGGLLRNENGHRFMPDYHPDAELAPRDIVSRSIFRELQKTNTNQVYIDLTKIPLDVHKRFPNISKTCKNFGLDISKDLIPVAPAAHYFMGGIRTDILGRTTIPGIYAAGEATSLGVHGANRLASNSLLDGLVFGYRAAQDALSVYKTQHSGPDPKHTLITDFPSQIKRSDLNKIRHSIRNTLWHYVGIIRSKQSLETALKILESHNQVLEIKSRHPFIQEIKNMLVLSQLITQFALFREESRGAHFRSDFPNRKDDIWRIHQVKNSITETLDHRPLNTLQTAL